MTDLIKRSTTHAILWWPVLLRGGLYIAIATLTAALSEMDSVTTESLAQMTWLDWSKSILTVFIVGLTTLRTFVDNSVGVHAAKIEADSTVQPTVTLQT